MISEGSVGCCSSLAVVDMIGSSFTDTIDIGRLGVKGNFDLSIENEQACINKETVFANRFAVSFEDENEAGEPLGRIYIPRMLLTENLTGMKIDPKITERFIVFDFKIKIKKKKRELGIGRDFSSEVLFRSHDTYEHYSSNSFGVLTGNDKFSNVMGNRSSIERDMHTGKEYKYPKVGDRFVLKRRYIHKDDTEIPSGFHVTVIKVYNKHFIENVVTGRYKIENSRRYGVVEVEVDQADLTFNRSIISSQRNKKYDIDWLTPV